MVDEHRKEEDAKGADQCPPPDVVVSQANELDDVEEDLEGQSKLLVIGEDVASRTEYHCEGAVSGKMCHTDNA